MKIEIQRNETSHPLVYENALNAYTKGPMYCVLFEKDGQRVTHKFPLCSLFLVVEDYLPSKKSMTQPAHYPLTWPEHIERAKSRETGRFKTTINSALKNVEDSIRRFGADSGRAAKDIVISSNYSLGDRKPTDPGVAVWFTWDNLSVCIPVDRYATIEANLQAIHHVVEARRVELRHGTLALVRASFRGFQALPPPPGSKPKRAWRQVFDFTSDSVPNPSDIDSRFKALSKQRHPDMPTGSHAAMTELNEAYSEAKATVAA